MFTDTCATVTRGVKCFSHMGFYRRRRRKCTSNHHAKYQCPNCPCIFVWKCTLRRHLRNECGKDPRFKCPYCDYCGKWKANITRHITRVHKNCSNYVLITN
ncbi:longitudinals lacking protein, isoforms A/B/D/L-like [Temnothorax curvispinosus]|uniref:Longitudinals lacking protein, isoforms A/B/D/L-like n=1 Tax=Temnothorax curvispinosus TaxID=300111 RepID=A0A6J1R9P9_9HYME|nr:longitudinals lacking protein, isoforms A/B/D/L-like [Temnothorax curvispinosus]